MRRTLFLTSLLLAACTAADSSDPNASEDAGSGGRPVADAGDRPADDASAADVPVRPDVSDDVPSTRPDADLSPQDAGSDAAGACTASDLDDAIDCQIAANDLFVDAFCDCFTETGYDGDRAACEADQPTAEAFQPDACVRAALLLDEPASVANSLCYAAAVDDLAACVGVCPPTEADFNACFAALNAGFDRCDAALPARVEDAITACDDPVVEPPGDVSAATTSLTRQRDDWSDAFCDCYSTEFGGVSSCTTSLRADWDPGLSPCEQTAFAALPADALPFLQCLIESFLIAETSCIDCPAAFDIEYELCRDPRFDIQFCFNEASPALQERLLDCTGG